MPTRFAVVLRRSNGYKTLFERPEYDVVDAHQPDAPLQAMCPSCGAPVALSAYPESIGVYTHIRQDPNARLCPLNATFLHQEK